MFNANACEWVFSRRGDSNERPEMSDSKRRGPYESELDSEWTGYDRSIGVAIPLSMTNKRIDLHIRTCRRQSNDKQSSDFLVCFFGPIDRETWAQNGKRVPITGRIIVLWVNVESIDKTTIETRDRKVNWWSTTNINNEATVPSTAALSVAAEYDKKKGRGRVTAGCRWKSSIKSSRNRKDCCMTKR